MFPPAHEGSDAQATRIVLHGPADPGFFRVEAHAAQLDHVEDLPVRAEAPLAVEDGTGTLAVDHDPEEGDDGAARARPTRPPMMSTSRFT